MFSDHIKSFLLKELQNHNISRKKLSTLSKVSEPVIHNLLHGTRPNPSLNSILSIANFFDTKIDNILGKTKDIPHEKIKKISTETALNNLKTYINKHLNDNNIKPVKLAQVLGVGAAAIQDFIDTPPKKKSLGTNIIFKLSEHLDISIDEMIGRTTPEKDLSVTKKKEDLISPISNKDDLLKLDQIKANLKTNAHLISTKDKIIDSKSDKTKSFVERLKQERANKPKDRQI